MVIKASVSANISQKGHLSEMKERDQERSPLIMRLSHITGISELQTSTGEAFPLEMPLVFLVRTH